MLSAAMRRAKRASSRSRSIPTFCGLHPWVPLGSQIDPVRILANNQRNLLGAAPSLELRLAGDCLVHVVIRLPIEQSRDVVSGREAFEVMEFVLEDTFMQISGESDVQGTGKLPMMYTQKYLRSHGILECCARLPPVSVARVTFRNSHSLIGKSRRG